MQTNNTVTVTVNTAQTTPAPDKIVRISSPDIEAEARLRIASANATAKAAAMAADQKAQQEAEIRARLHKDELIKLKAHEMEIRIAAERLVMEAEAKRAIDEREAKIQKEIERLQNRTEAEVLKEDIAFLQNEMTTLKEKLSCAFRN